MQHPDEGMIHTWLDGELPAEEAAALEAHAAECEQCKAAIAEARGFIAATSRIVSALDAVPAGVIPIRKPVKRVWYSSPQFRAAAAVLVVAGASLLVMRTGTQKATLAVATTTEANAAAKVQAVRPSEPAPSKGYSNLNASVQQPVAANKVAANRVAAKEEDFSGKGVKGGAAAGVMDAAVILDSGAAGSGAATKFADELSSRTDLRMAKADLKVLRVDSTATTRKTTYQSWSGSEVVLTENELEPVLSAAIVTGVAVESRQRAAPATPASPPPVAKAPAAPAPVAQLTAPIQTIRWMDLATRKSYSLSGPVSVEELEAIKARLLQAKR